MSFKAWRLWVKALPLSMKWLVVLILIRPVVDVLYFLKEISPLISPLYIVGFLTPLFIGFSLLSKKLPPRFKSIVTDFSFWVWSVLVFFNLILLLWIDATFESVGNALRYLTPILFYFYFRRMVNSKRQLTGVLVTFLYSAAIPAGILLYELIIGPISTQELTANRGGGSRYQGGYADVMNYAIYASSAFLIKSYLFLKRMRKRKVGLRQIFELVMVYLFCFAALVAIKQASSWGVLTVLTGLFILFTMSNRKGAVLFILLMPVLIFFGGQIYSSKIRPLVQKEMMIVEGEREIDQSFNGRVNRWKKYFEAWEEMPLSSNVFGVNLSSHELAPVMISGGMHSDYIRLLFLSGVVGLMAYLFFLISLFKRVISMAMPERFLVVGALLAIGLYSLTTCPLNYAPFIYVIFPIFAYAALPKNVLKKQNV